MQYSFSVGDIDKLQIEEEERNKRVGNFSHLLRSQSETKYNFLTETATVLLNVV